MLLMGSGLMHPVPHPSLSHPCDACPLQITSAVLVAPGSVTHSFNSNQRVVKLVISSVNLSTNTLTLVVSLNVWGMCGRGTSSRRVWTWSGDPSPCLAQHTAYAQYSGTQMDCTWVDTVSDIITHGSRAFPFQFL